MRTTAAARHCLAVLAAVSALLHLMLLGHGPFWLSMVMAGLAVLCFPCAGHLWRGPSVRTWAAIGTMNVGMLLLHLWMLTGGESPTTGGLDLPSAEQHHPGAGAASPWLSLDHTVLLYAATAVAVVEVCGALWAGAVLLCGCGPQPPYSEVLSGKAITERNRIGRFTSAVGPWGASPSNCSESPGRRR